MPKMSDSDLRALLDAEHSDAMAATSSAKLSEDRSNALAYYNGDMAKDMPTEVGRSKAVSMDTADTIEGMLPQLMEIFTASDEPVRFNPVGPEDINAAEQETDYVNHVFMNQNPGFLVLYSFIKDALLSKLGVVKVWWEETEEEERETYYDQSDDAFAMLASQEAVEIVEHTAHPSEQRDPMSGQPVTLHDVTIVKTTKSARAVVEAVPPEEFGIERNARSLRDCNYCFHKVMRTESQLIEQGYDAKQIKGLPSFTALTNEEEIQRDTVDENSGADGDNINSAARKIQVIEHYVRMDYEKKGKACLYRVVTGGSGGAAVILKRDGKPDIEPFDFMPFAAMTPIIITHRFFGRSIADLVKDIQQIKTALYRALLDNAYLANNPRVEVSEQMAGPNTIDDLLVSRPGGIVRTKVPGGLTWQTVPTIGNNVFPLLEYIDQTREQRTGVTKQGQGLDANALQNQSATAASQLFTVAQARIRLVARIFAETGIKDLFWLLHGLIRKHGQKAETVRLRNNWVQVDPRQWKNRADLTVSVGLGTGSKTEQFMHGQLLLGLQEKAVALGLVSKKNFYNSAKRIVKLMGEKDPEAYFIDPTKPPDQQQQGDEASQPIPPPTSPDAQKAEVEKMKAQAAMQIQASEHQSNMARSQAEIQKAATEAQVKIIEANAAAHNAQMQQQLAAAQIQVDQLKAQAQNQTVMAKAALDNLVKLEIARINASKDTDSKPDAVENKLSHDAGVSG